MLSIVESPPITDRLRPGLC